MVQENNIRKPIDWWIISESIDYYTKCGFEYIETPWIVDKTISKMTYNGGLAVGERVLVGSAEQGFLALNLPKGKYVSCSPCFRENEHGQYNFPDFMKVELYVNYKVPEFEILKVARTFFERYCKCEIIVTDDGWDLITLSGIELGSYGYRNVDGKEWVYGTGVALPRLSQVIHI